MRMGLRLILAFALIATVTIASFLLVARETVALQVRSFVSRGGMMGIETLAGDLEEWYRQYGTWQGAEELLTSFRYGHGRGGMMGQGMMMGSLRLRLADETGRFAADNEQTGAPPQGMLSAGERQAAIVLHDASGAPVGYLLAEGGSSPAAEQQLLDGLVRAGWAAAGIAGLLSLLLALLLSYRLVKPIEALTTAASRMAGGDLSQRVPPGDRDELGTLGTSFNRMAASLEQAEQNRKAMTADIAHELRTPIAIQRAHLEALQDGVYPLTAENLQPVLEQTEMLTRLVEDLRTLALADAGELKIVRAGVLLPDLARRVVERFRPQAEQRGIRILLAVSEEQLWSEVPADGGRVEQILINLITNALRFTPEGGLVQVELRRVVNAVELSIADNGPGIAVEDLPRVFDRFYRADKARSRESGGTGLGLAIARQIALAHGGDLSAANRPEGGAKFSLRLPAA